MAEEKAQKAGRVDLRWTRKKRELFIRKLAETYDTELACEVSGLEWPHVCELRVRHPDFAARIEEVIAAGYDRLEMKLLRQAGAAPEPEGTSRPSGASVAPGAGGSVKIDVALAAALLKQRRALKSDAAAGAARRGAAAGAPRARGGTRAQLVDTIMARFTPPGGAAGEGDVRNGKANGKGDQEAAGEAH